MSKTKKSVKRAVRTLESRELLNATGGSCADVDPTGIAGLPDGIAGSIVHSTHKPGFSLGLPGGVVGSFLPPSERGALPKNSA